MSKIRFPICILFLLLPVVADPGGKTMLTLISAILHEAGHLAGIAAVGTGIEKITVTPYGFEIKTKKRCTSLYETLVITLAGPLVNLLLFLLFSFLGEKFQIFSVCNLLLFILNMMPVSCLDGGEALGAVLEKVYEPDKAVKIERITSFVFVILLWIPASYIFMLSGVNFSLFVICVWLFGKIFC